jgi:predicted phage terminase large subunit-like protein
VPGASPRGEPLIFDLTQRLAARFQGVASSVWPVLPVHDIQQQFLDSRALIKGFCGGRGAGKSWIGCYDLCLRAKANRLYMVIGPTFGQMRDSTLRSFKEVATQLGILRKVNRSDYYCIIDTQDGGQAQVNFRSADDPERMRGPNLSGIYGDEASVFCDEALTLAMACLREAGEMGWMTLTFTPKGREHWTYGWFYKKDATGYSLARDGRVLFRARTTDNQFLPPEYYAILSDQYVPGSLLAQQELDGEFVDMVGLQFLRAWFEGRIVQADRVPREAKRVRYWDKASSDGGDYTAGVLMARAPDGTFWIENVVRGQWTPYHRNREIRMIAQQDAKMYNNEVTIWIEQEPGSGGKESALISLDELAGHPVYIHRERQDKVVRAQPFRAKCEGGMVYLVDGPWLRNFLDELCGFPEAKHDDQVDAAVGGYSKLAAVAALEGPSEIIAYPQAPRQKDASSMPQPTEATDGQPEAPREGDELRELPENEFHQYLREYSGTVQPQETYQQRLHRYMFGDDR